MNRNSELEVNILVSTDTMKKFTSCIYIDAELDEIHLIVGKITFEEVSAPRLVLEEAIYTNEDATSV